MWSKNKNKMYLEKFKEIKDFFSKITFQNGELFGFRVVVVVGWWWTEVKRDGHKEPRKKDWWWWWWWCFFPGGALHFMLALYKKESSPSKNFPLAFLQKSSPKKVLLQKIRGKLLLLVHIFYGQFTKRNAAIFPRHDDDSCVLKKLLS